MQSAIPARPISAAIRLNPQSALRKMQHRFKRSNLELRGPENARKIGNRNSQGVRSVPFFAEIPNLPTKAGLER
eukprot:8982664-Alexandrium_andersonii.AAC.1